MKTLSFSIILLFHFYLAASQLTLEKSYEFSVGVATIAEDEQVYYLMDVANSQCRIFDLSHTLLKSIPIQLPADYYLSDIKYVTKHLFNMDDHIELLVIYEKCLTNEAGTYFKYGLKVIDETGSELLSVDDGAWAEIKYIQDKAMLLTYAYVFNPSGYYNISTKIYNIAGEVNAAIKIDKSPVVFPNPASDYVNISFPPVFFSKELEYRLISSDGKALFTTQVEAGSTLSIPVGHLKPGIYIGAVKTSNRIIQSDKIMIHR